MGTKRNVVKVGLRCYGRQWLRKKGKQILLTYVAKVLACNFDPLRERLFTFADPDTRIIELTTRSAVFLSPQNNHYLLVRLIGAFWVTNLRKKVILLLEDKVLEIVDKLQPKF